MGTVISENDSIYGFYNQVPKLGQEAAFSPSQTMTATQYTKLLGIWEAQKTALEEKIPKPSVPKVVSPRKTEGRKFR